MDGVGIYTFAAGHTYKGEWLQGRMHGTGVMNYASGHEYSGEWINNTRSGRGTLRYLHGDTFEGEFDNGIRVRGKHEFNERMSNVYEGEYSSDGRLRHGWGKLT